MSTNEYPCACGFLSPNRDEQVAHELNCPDAQAVMEEIETETAMYDETPLGILYDDPEEPYP